MTTDAQDDPIQDDEDSKAAYVHWMRPDPDNRAFIGPIESVEDPVTGRVMRRRAGKVGMVRGALEENLKDVTVWLDPVPHIRLDKGADLRGWYNSKDDGALRGQRDRPCMTDAVLTTPYSGYCPISCGACYVNSGKRGYRGSGLVTVPLNYGDHVRKQLKSMKVAGAGYITSFSDPFLSIEEYYHNSQGAAEAFADEGLPVFFLSRMVYPGWAIDVLRRNRLSYAQKSLNTPDPEDWKKLSPGASGLLEHLEDIRELKRQGIYTSIQVNPVIAGIVTHEDIERLFEMLAEVGNDHVIVKFVEANYPWANAMVERMTKRFGDNRAAAFKELFVDNGGGGQRTVSEEYRLEGHARYQKKATQLGMTYASCFEFRKTESGRFVSIGKDVLTADQCHGQRVPMFARPLGQLDVPFAEVAECPPSGCLTCADDNGGKARCGSDLLGEAKALRLPDFRRGM